MDLNVTSKKDLFNPNSMTFEERQAQLDKEAADEQNRQKHKKDSPFSNFYQFNREYSKEMIWLAGAHPKANAILLFLLDQMDDYNAVMCSYDVMQEALGMSLSTVRRSVKVLKECGFIAIYKSGNSNIYAVNKVLAWSSWGTNYRYAKFAAKIIISESEQETNIEDVGFEKPKILKIKDNDKA